MKMTYAHWTNRDGTEWACAASDHGPFCRLCQNITDDEMAKACLENVDDGYMEVQADKDGKFEFRTTSLGNARALELFKETGGA